VLGSLNHANRWLNLAPLKIFVPKSFIFPSRVPQPPLGLHQTIAPFTPVRYNYDVTGKSMGKFQITWLEDYSDQALIDEIKRVASLVPDRRLDIETFNSLSKVSSSAIGRRFGTWTEAARKAGLPNALPDYSTDSILDDLRRIAGCHPDAPFTNDFYATHGGRYSRSIFKTRFGGWREALVSAGIEARYSGRLTTQRMRHQPGRDLTNEDILATIRAIGSKLDKTTLSGTDIQNHSDISKGLLTSRFGSISAAINLAGLSSAHCRHSDDDVFENLLRVWTFYGRAPTHLEIDKPPSVVSSATYIRRFGGWRNALKQFVERFGSDDAPPPKPSIPTPAPTHLPVKASPAINIPQNPTKRPLHVASLPITNKRDPSIGLRFKVLQRDHFRCKLCGRSPATDPGCKLHVDHIVPFAKGGKTLLHNLQTLCSECNLGKGSKYVS
jgi:hypothetical protein